MYQLTKVFRIFQVCCEEDLKTLFVCLYWRQLLGFPNDGRPKLLDADVILADEDLAERCYHNHSTQPRLTALEGLQGD